MSNIHQINTKNSKQALSEDIILDQASDWIAKVDRALSNKEKQQLQQWLAKSPAHLNTFLDVAKLWDKMDDLSRLSDIFPQSDFAQSKHANNAKKQSFTGTAWLGAVAASVLFSVYIGMNSQFDFPMPFGDSTRQSVVAMQANYHTEIGESSTINLPDKSKIVLNTNSFVQIKYTKTARIIELQRGEIHIDVAHDKSRPLSVIAGGEVIQAVGTAFNVEVSDSLVELIVTDGKVLVGKTSQLPVNTTNDDISIALPISSLAISKGEKVNLDSRNNVQEIIEKVNDVDIAAKLSWRSGNLIFRGESLADTMKEISRYTNIEFELAENDYLKQVKVAGMFKTGDVNGLLNALSQNFQISYEKVSNDKILLKYSG